jgi:hypothetical protein
VKTATNINDAANIAPVVSIDRAFGRHFSVGELAVAWGLDESTVRRMFQDMPGVLKIGKGGRCDGRRSYFTLRIPEWLALQVYSERAA